jgi:hypothetical protein
MGLATQRRQGAADRRTIDPGQRLEHKPGDRHQRPGIARRHRSLSLARLDEIHSHPHRRILLVAHGQRGRFVHANHFGGTLDA